MEKPLCIGTYYIGFSKKSPRIGIIPQINHHLAKVFENTRREKNIR